MSIRNLHASVNGKSILKGVNLDIGRGEIHVLMGPNGAGKSTLANVVMGDPRYRVDEGSVLFQGQDITGDKPDVRARKGLFLSFQAPEAIPGITVESFLRAAKAAHTGEEVKILPFRKELRDKMRDVGMDPSYGSRHLNVGFSGGERKKSEILQMLMLNPRLAMLDETDSGLDVDSVRMISESVRRYHDEDHAVLIITHIASILERLAVDYVHVMVDGRIVKTSDASLVEKIGRDGFASVIS